MMFEGRLRFLSNFWPTQIIVPEPRVETQRIKFPSVEHAFQAAKTESLEEKLTILHCETPGRAKRMAKKITIRPEWMEVREQVMEELVRQKFAHRALANSLLMVEGEIVEGNSWHDVFWGKCICEIHKGEGENKLGLILMKIRSEIE